MNWRLPARTITFPRRPLVMGIVNINDDSFSGDGTLDFPQAAQIAISQIHAGADIIDVGAESARTNRAAIPPAEEIRRFQRFLRLWSDILAAAIPRDSGQISPPILSVNTWRPDVIEAILPLGHIELVNDMSGLPDDRNARLCAAARASLLIMHSVGEPKVPHLTQQWPDIAGELNRFFTEKLGLAQAAGLHPDSIILDPGIDFAKQRDDNLTVYRELAGLRKFGRPVLVPVSRKTVIGEVLDLPEPTDRDAGTVACITASMLRGAEIFRVHNVPAAWQTVKTLAAIHDGPAPSK
ncbi:dihydropteroate synthase [Luteolibacter sp. SL250]|uniref:dihydropteroate synthase n=1 Tax=Luteolibacter sp. SL250 TaxID=2995170 RepID=UPI00226D5548|nr:dihydropteroate synthase [Luteolibacter sp. SL250]WAC20945.1 dihydropteroate synthase [Luteolibacter sp. SL250]